MRHPQDFGSWERTVFVSLELFGNLSIDDLSLDLLGFHLVTLRVHSKGKRYLYIVRTLLCLIGMAA